MLNQEMHCAKKESMNFPTTVVDWKCAIGATHQRLEGRLKMDWIGLDWRSYIHRLNETTGPGTTTKAPSTQEAKRYKAKRTEANMPQDHV